MTQDAKPMETRSPRGRRLSARGGRTAEPRRPRPDPPGDDPENSPGGDDDVGADSGDERPETLLDDPTLDELGIPARYYDELTDAGITTLSELDAFGDLTQIRGIGPKADAEIRSAVADYLAAE